MQKRTLGNQLEVPSIGLGCRGMSFGRIYKQQYKRADDGNDGWLCRVGFDDVEHWFVQLRRRERLFQKFKIT